MSPARRNAAVVLALGAFSAVTWIVFRGYLTPEMMVYFLSFRWCL